MVTKLELFSTLGALVCGKQFSCAFLVTDNYVTWSLATFICSHCSVCSLTAEYATLYFATLACYIHTLTHSLVGPFEIICIYAVNAINEHNRVCCRH